MMNRLLYRMSSIRTHQEQLSDLDIAISHGITYPEHIYSRDLVDEWDNIAAIRNWGTVLNYQALDRLIMRELSKRTIRLPEEVLVENYSNDCSICLESIKEKVVILDCQHGFHRECIIKWERNSCPYCRQVIDKSVSNIGEEPSID